MCLELRKILDTINLVLPAIESAQPGCRSGIQELCSLNNAVEKAKLLLQHCAETSKLYLVITFFRLTVVLPILLFLCLLNKKMIFQRTVVSILSAFAEIEMPTTS